MRKPHIGLVTSSIDNRRARGTALVARKFLEGLGPYRDRYAFTLIHHEPSDDPLYAQHDELVIPRLPWPFDRHLLREAVFWLGRHAKRANGFDVVHYLHPRVWPSYLLTDSRSIVISAFEGGHMLKQNRLGNENLIFRLTSRFLNQRMDRLIACSDSGRDEVIETYRVPPSTVSRIYLGTGHEYRTIDPHRAAERAHAYGITLPYFLAVSRFDPHKNIHGLLEAYERMLVSGDAIPLVLVGGPHTPGYSERILDACTRLRERGADIRIVPFVEDEDMPAIYSAATALVYPSLHEGFGLPVAEAMACGTAVITTNISSLPEVAGDAALLVEPGNSEALADAMRRILKEPSFRASLEATGPIQSACFTWERMAAETVSLYDELLGSLSAATRS